LLAACGPKTTDLPPPPPWPLFPASKMATVRQASRRAIGRTELNLCRWDKYAVTVTVSVEPSKHLTSIFAISCLFDCLV
jgi:hypothetical protein